MFALGKPLLRMKRQATDWKKICAEHIQLMLLFLYSLFVNSPT